MGAGEGVSGRFLDLAAASPDTAAHVVRVQTQGAKSVGISGNMAVSRRIAFAAGQDTASWQGGLRGRKPYAARGKGRHPAMAASPIGFRCIIGKNPKLGFAYC